MLEFLIMLWLTVALIVGIPSLIKDLIKSRKIRKGLIENDEIDKFILR